MRRPFFGDLHVHTTFSFDAYTIGNDLNDPLDTFEFARGEGKQIPDGDVTRSLQLRRPLDFVAVTDHSEYVDETRICKNQELPGYDSEHCEILRGEAPEGVSAFALWNALRQTCLNDVEGCEVLQIEAGREPRRSLERPDRTTGRRPVPTRFGGPPTADP